MIKKVTVNTLQKIKDSGERFSALAAYDYSTAKYFDQAGIDVILVGDSLAMTALGYDTTLNVGIEEMSVFVKAVSRGVSRAMVMADMPFMYNVDLKSALTNIGLLARCGAAAVKIEGCSDFNLEVTRRSIETGVPVIGHLGFTPQFVNAIGGYNIQGKTYDATLKILEQAKKFQDAGSFAILLEMVPEESARFITDNLEIPTISCGAGRYCTGQIVVGDDMLGKFSEFTPKFVRKYGDMKSLIFECAQKYDYDVKHGNFPSDDEVYKLSGEELQQLKCSNR